MRFLSFLIMLSCLHSLLPTLLPVKCISTFCSMRCVFEVCKVPDMLSYVISFISKTDDQHCQRQYA